MLLSAVQALLPSLGARVSAPMIKTLQVPFFRSFSQEVEKVVVLPDKPPRDPVLDQIVRDQIHDIVDANKVVLFMKGVPKQPLCGFSMAVVKLLRAAGVPFSSIKHVDVARDPIMKDGIKDFTEWPTIPQLFVDREFVGGFHVVLESFKSGDLDEMLDNAGVAREVDEEVIRVNENE
eukprot:TRINITY_DN26701_c0_g1_i1.p1 TRINITY_DN26701_c0_g1~~TRINITY_DN26701_c0_g1_i1.p1  ORF type:complete len:177 (+),score=24.61 TRINITY_DN26701_c0_g1_i1:71-601(+)